MGDPRPIQIETLAGSGSSEPYAKQHEDGPAHEARFRTLTGLAVGMDRVFMPEYWSGRVRQMYYGNPPPPACSRIPEYCTMAARAVLGSAFCPFGWITVACISPCIFRRFRGARSSSCCVGHRV